MRTGHIFITKESKKRLFTQKSSCRFWLFGVELVLLLEVSHTLSLCGGLAHRDVMYVGLVLSSM